MATTPEIVDAARKLGALIATHPAAQKFHDIVGKLQKDVEAQRLLNDFNRAMQKVAEKEAAGKPIEVEDKRQVERLQNQVIRHAALRDLQMAQMDYLDLMRQVDEAMGGAEEPLPTPAAGPGGPRPAAPPLVRPDVAT